MIIKKKWITLLFAGAVTVSLAMNSAVMAKESIEEKTTEEVVEETAKEAAAEDAAALLPLLPEGVEPVTWEVSKDNLMIRTDEAREFYTKIKANEYPSIDELKESNVVHQLDALRDYYMAMYGATIDINTPERALLRNEVLDEFLSLGSARTESVDENGHHKYVYDGPLKKGYQMELVLGLPASGKSTMIADPDSEEMGAFILDPDVIKAMLPEYKETHGAAADCVHMEGMLLMKTALNAFTEGDLKGVNVIIPKAPANIDDLMVYIKPFEDAGYNVKAKFMEAEPNVSMARVFARTLEGGQLISSKVVFSITTEPEEVYNELAPMINAQGEPYGCDEEETLAPAA